MPDIHVHGFTALEVTEGAKRLGEPLAAYLTRLKDAGLGPLPGTAAEILDDEVRAVLCPDKIDTEEWLEAHRTAHSGRPALQHHDHVRLGRAPGALGPAPGPHPRPAEGDRRLHRVRAAAVRAHGRADLPQARRPARTDLARVVLMHAVGPDRLPRLDRQHPGVLGQARPDGARQLLAAAASTTSAAR